MMLSAEDRGALLRRLGREAGFDLVGLAPARALDPSPFEQYFAEGLHADMEWMRDERRVDPRLLLPGAKTVAVFALSYFDPAASPGRVARYARGTDYHSILRRKLRKLRKALAAADPGVRTYGSVDWGPIAEKPWAQAAGLGWIGKNGCLITRSHGSWVVLGALVLDQECLPYDEPHRDFCGDCAACLPSCPTRAFPRPYVVDASRCLSYQTIENRGAVPDELKEGTSGWIFGCDACQEVCPWNRRFAEPTREAGFLPRTQALWDVPLARLISMDHAEWSGRARGTAMARPKHFGTVRNALLAAGESGDLSLVDACATRLDDPHEGVRDAAEWAVRRLGSDPDELRRAAEALPPCGAGLDDTSSHGDDGAP
ncbi:tRNA epoxyqueuosine(34) reductase QueG [Vulgatibacter incomptus]|uniref:Epoxyqueuosine (OQ) reductase QueG n=1 Tax=Vulgatibacter incomptus TaxID=1391653 RepID=A0A0K1PAH2_9BACT|nr:tRNA epoxyqueuosine(34) reductase QueG [Vulgatibacter incomptus]AKU90114.1 Epoxyqueuosine (oQ) reductase QueG [Vulgatibacter incomptus]